METKSVAAGREEREACARMSGKLAQRDRERSAWVREGGKRGEERENNDEMEVLQEEEEGGKEAWRGRKECSGGHKAKGWWILCGL